jgi:hypothetical protein
VGEKNFLEEIYSPPHPLFQRTELGDLLNAKCGIDEDFA